MKTIPVILFFLLVGSVWGGDYSQQFHKAWSRKDFGGMKKILEDWQKSDPHDAEWFVASGNYAYAKAKEGAPSLPEPSSTEPLVVWCPLPEAGSTTPDPAYFDRPLMTQAVTCWQTALEALPNRLDIAFNLARLYQDRGEFDAQYNVLARAFQYADKNQRDLKWMDGSILPKPVSVLAPPLIQDAVTHYLFEGGSANAERAHRLVRLDLTFFPNDLYAYNSLAAYYSTQGDWPRTLKYLLIASLKAPKNALILFNIGNTLDEIGKKREARIFYRKVVKLDPDSPYGEQAGIYLKNGSRNGNR